MEHISIVEKKSADGAVLYYRLYTDEGYQIHCPLADSTKKDEDGNEVTVPYYSNGIMVVRDYDFTLNPSQFEAVKI